MKGKIASMHLKVRNFSICGQLSFSPSLCRAKEEKKMLGTVKDGLKIGKINQAKTILKESDLS